VLLINLKDLGQRCQSFRMIMYSMCSGANISNDNVLDVQRVTARANLENR